MNDTLSQHTIVLLGAGHTNAHILRMWQMEPIADARLVCVSNMPIATYSGMLPGTLAGLYEPREMEIDLVRLCRSVGATLILDAVTGCDLAEQKLIFESRPPLTFDALSVGIGSVPDLSMVEGDAALAIKPMQTFLERLDERAAQAIASRDGPLRFAVIGGGVAGVEIALALTVWQPSFELSAREVTILDSGEDIAGGLNAPARCAARRELGRRGVQMQLGDAVVRVADGGIALQSGARLPCDIAILATPATAPALLGEFQSPSPVSGRGVRGGGIPQDARGFLLTDATLRVLSGAPVFAVGDSGTIDGANLPKAGVYAVRQGPILWQNIQRQLSGQPLVAYRPQRNFLKLLSTGDRRAIASYGPLGAHAGWCWRWKDQLDRRFMQKYQNYGAKPMTAATPASKRQAPDSLMRCVGCGGKVSGDVLHRVLQQLDIPTDDRVTHGLNSPDDAATLKLPAGESTVATVDFFAPPVNDMYLAGRLAAVNAASDLAAMGAEPVAALAAVTLPHGPSAQQEQLLYELLAGGLHELRAMGATLAGGHTLEGPRVTIGFTMLGTNACRPPLTKTGLQVGDALVLTKPLGTGVLLAAHAQGHCRAEWFTPMIDAMLQHNFAAAKLRNEFPISAATDVTGFGLAGHLLEMLIASGVSATIELDRVPLLPGFRELVADGYESTMAPANRTAEPQISATHELRQRAEYAVLFDPQTAGGLLLALTTAAAKAITERLPAAHIIGEVVQSQGRPQIYCQ